MLGALRVSFPHPPTRAPSSPYHPLSPPPLPQTHSPTLLLLVCIVPLLCVCVCVCVLRPLGVQRPLKALVARSACVLPPAASCTHVQGVHPRPAVCTLCARPAAFCTALEALYSPSLTPFSGLLPPLRFWFNGCWLFQVVVSCQCMGRLGRFLPPSATIRCVQS